MSIGIKLLTHARQMKLIPCKRCGYGYDPEKESTCPTCGNLSNFEVEQLHVKREKEKAGNKRIGLWFLFFAFLIVIFIAAVNT